jgi:hypothetical protein
MVAGLFWNLRIHASELPPVGEILDLLRTNLTGLDAQRFNQLAVQGVLQGFDGYAHLISSTEGDIDRGASLASVKVFESNLGYVRLNQIDESTPKALAEVIEGLRATNQLKGVVLDLRFAVGTNFGAAAKVADIFVTADQPLLDWGEGIYSSSAKSLPPPSPLAILVNQETHGAAVAVAAVLREANTAMIVGSKTGGKAARYRDFTLSSGQPLRIAIATIKTGSGAVIAPEGIRPDIEVSSRPEVERAYLADPFTPIVTRTNASNATNQIVSSVHIRKKLTEADLVRSRQVTRETNAPQVTAMTPEPPRPVRDPALARALDLLKALSIVRQFPPTSN